MPEPEVVEFSEDPWQLAAAIDRLLIEPAHIDVSSVRRPPCARFSLLPACDRGPEYNPPRTPENQKF